MTSGRITAVEPTAFIPPDRTDNLYTAFVQDDVSITPERLRLVFGTKVEHNDYSGVEIQPSARLLWTMDPSNTFFLAATRAVRTPSRVETDYTTTSLADPATPAFVRLQPNPQFTAEKLTSYELGYRVRAIPALYVTTALFVNRLEKTLSTELSPAFVETSPDPPRLILPVSFRNGLHGHSHGIEITGDFRPTAWSRWTANYSWLRVEMTKNAGSTDVSQERRYEGLSPQHQVQLQSSLDLPRGVSLDWFLRYASELPAGPVPGYATSTVRLGWQLHPEVELALVGQNLHDARHLEWPAGAGGNLEIRRSVHVGVVWRQ